MFLHPNPTQYNRDCEKWQKLYKIAESAQILAESAQKHAESAQILADSAQKQAEIGILWYGPCSLYGPSFSRVGRIAQVHRLWNLSCWRIRICTCFANKLSVEATLVCGHASTPRTFIVSCMLIIKYTL